MRERLVNNSLIFFGGRFLKLKKKVNSWLISDMAERKKTSRGRKLATRGLTAEI